MSRHSAIVAAFSMLGVSLAGCAQEEERAEERGHNIRVRAPYTSVDVHIPDDDADDSVDVDVDVDD